MLINENDYTYFISYREWYCTQIVDFLIALDQKKRAIDFVSKTFLDRGVNRVVADDDDIICRQIFEA